MSVSNNSDTRVKSTTELHGICCNFQGVLVCVLDGLLVKQYSAVEQLTEQTVSTF